MRNFSATFVMPFVMQRAKMPAPGKEQAQKARYLMLWERSLHLVEFRKMT